MEICSACQKRFAIVSIIRMTTSERISTRMVNLPLWKGSRQKRRRGDVNVRLRIPRESDVSEISARLWIQFKKKQHRYLYSLKRPKVSGPPLGTG